MKHTLLVILLTFGSSLVYSQGQKSKSEPANQRTQELKLIVELDATQEEQANHIFNETDKKSNAVSTNKSLSSEQKSIEFGIINAKEDTELDKLLSQDQKDKINKNSGPEPQKANINRSRSNIKQDN